MGVPLYKQLADELKSQISTGELQPNAQIPSQTELAQRFGVSVVTIQKALALLVDEGLIYRVRKRGSFVKGVAANRESPVRLPIDRVYLVYNQSPLEVFAQEFHMACLQGIMETCDSYGLPFHLLNMRDNWELPDFPSVGLVLWGFSRGNDRAFPGTDFIEAVGRWRTAGIPMVIVHQYFSHLNVPRINCDNVQGAFMATKHLLSLGHRRIGILLSGESKVELKPEFVLRLQGYRMALQSEGVQFDPDLLLATAEDYYQGEPSGYQDFQRLMRNPVPPTAVFAGTDLKAVGAMYAAQDIGMRVPDDMSIIGYNGNRFGASVLPTLTTIDQDFTTLGRQAAALLLQGTASDTRELLIPPKLILRQSTKPLDT